MKNWYQVVAKRIELYMNLLFCTVYSNSKKATKWKLNNTCICSWWYVGIRDELLSEHLQMEVDLALDKTKMLIWQREAVQQQQGMLKGESVVNVRHKKTRLAKLKGGH